MLFPKLSVFEVNYNALSTPLDTVLKSLQQMTQLIRIFQTFMEDINIFSLGSGHLYLSPRGWATFGGHQTFYTGFGGHQNFYTGFGGHQNFKTDFKGRQNFETSFGGHHNFREF